MLPISNSPGPKGNLQDSNKSKGDPSADLAPVVKKNLSNDQTLVRMELSLIGAGDDFLEFDTKYDELKAELTQLERELADAVGNGESIDYLVNQIRTLQAKLTKLSSNVGNRFPKLQDKILNAKLRANNLSETLPIYYTLGNLDEELSQLLKLHEYKDSLVDNANRLFMKYNKLEQELAGKNFGVAQKIQKSQLKLMNFIDACKNYKNLEKMFTIKNFQDASSLDVVLDHLLSASHFNLDSFIKFRLPRTEAYHHLEATSLEKFELESRPTRLTPQELERLNHHSKFIRLAREFDLACENTHHLPALGLNQMCENIALRRNIQAEETLASLLAPKPKSQPLPAPKAPEPIVIVKAESENMREELELKLKNRLVDQLNRLPNGGLFFNNLLNDSQSKLSDLFNAAQERINQNPHLNNTKLELIMEDVKMFLESTNSIEPRQNQPLARDTIPLFQRNQYFQNHLESSLYSNLFERYNSYLEMMNDPESIQVVREHLFEALKNILAETKARIGRDPQLFSERVRDLIQKAEAVVDPVRPDVADQEQPAQPAPVVESSCRIVTFLKAALLAIRELAGKVYDKLFPKPIEGNPMTGAPFCPLDHRLNRVQQVIESCA